jgi:DNA-binding NtrC family response regulator
VSKEKFRLEKIVKKLFDAISNERSDGLSLRYMANKISDELTNKRFLLVMNDVWTQDRIKWAEFMVQLKNGSPGSRILLTTRSTNVAEAVESTALIDLPLLSKDYSWQVFRQSYGNAVEHDFEEVGKEIVNKCSGVPLAIKVLAGVLRDKKRVEQWHAVKE